MFSCDIVISGFPEGTQEGDLPKHLGELGDLLTEVYLALTPLLVKLQPNVDL